MKLLQFAYDTLINLYMYPHSLLYMWTGTFLIYLNWMMN